MDWLGPCQPPGAQPGGCL